MKYFEEKDVPKFSIKRHYWRFFYRTLYARIQRNKLFFSNKLSFCIIEYPNVDYVYKVKEIYN